MLPPTASDQMVEASSPSRVSNHHMVEETVLPGVSSLPSLSSQPPLYLLPPTTSQDLSDFIFEDDEYFYIGPEFDLQESSTTQDLSDFILEEPEYYYEGPEFVYDLPSCFIDDDQYLGDLWTSLANPLEVEVPNLKTEDWFASQPEEIDCQSIRPTGTVGPQQDFPITWSPSQVCDPTVLPNRKTAHDKARQTFPKFPDWLRKAKNWIDKLPRRTTKLFQKGPQQKIGLDDRQVRFD